jgi:putative transposase
MDQLLGHRQTKGSETDMLNLQLPRHISTLPNACYRRSESLWEGRYRLCPVQSESYLLACQRYIELNPARAGRVGHPAEYRWSSYRANAQGERDILIHPHYLYSALGTDAGSRQTAYRDLFRNKLEPGLIDEILRASNGNHALGNNLFAGQISAAVGRRVIPGRSGRPRKQAEPESGRLFE